MSLEIVTAAELAELLRISKWTVYELARSGRIPCIKIGRSVRFNLPTVYRILNK